MSEDGYTGSCTLRCEGTEVTAEVVLRGFFQPIDGRYHWYGRVSAPGELDDLVGSRRKEVEVATPQGKAVGTLSDLDPWHRYRVTGTGIPPFTLDTSLAPAE